MAHFDELLHARPDQAWRVAYDFEAQAEEEEEEDDDLAMEGKAPVFCCRNAKAPQLFS